MYILYSDKATLYIDCNIFPLFIMSTLPVGENCGVLKGVYFVLIVFYGVFLQDCHVIVWTKDETKPGPWEPVRLHKFNDVVWHLSWSFAGNILAVSGGDNSVSTN